MVGGRRHVIALLPGDGIGPEVVAATVAALRVVAETTPALRFEFVEAPIGRGALEAHGSPLPDHTVRTARSADAVLHGASDTASIPAGLPRPVRSLRRALGVFASCRPSRSSPVGALHPDVDVMVVRELTEGTYSGHEFMVGPDAACSVRVATRDGIRRVAGTAFQLARRRRKRVGLVHKRGGLPVGDGLWVDVVQEVAAGYDDVELALHNVDAAVHELIRHPGRFDVLLAENQYGDILSDAAAAVAGGIGLAASAGFGQSHAYFEPVHGTAPDIAGQGVANPMATMLAAVLMLEHLGEQDAADTLRSAVGGALRDGVVLTPDLGGRATTREVTEAVCRRIRPGGADG